MQLRHQRGEQQRSDAKNQRKDKYDLKAVSPDEKQNDGREKTAKALPDAANPT